MKDMFKEAGINLEGRSITGHSVKVTCTSLYSYVYMNRLYKREVVNGPMQSSCINGHRLRER